MNHTLIKSHAISILKRDIGFYANNNEEIIESFMVSDFNQSEADIEVEIHCHNIDDVPSYLMEIHEEIFSALSKLIKPAFFTYTSTFYKSKITGCHSLKFHFKIQIP